MGAETGGSWRLLPLRQLPLSFRALFSGFLLPIGVGYLMALSHVFRVDVGPHERLGMGLLSGIS